MIGQNYHPVTKIRNLSQKSVRELARNVTVLSRNISIDMKATGQKNKFNKWFGFKLNEE